MVGQLCDDIKERRLAHLSKESRCKQNMINYDSFAEEYDWKSHGTGTLRSTLGAYHRPISQYINDFMESGFVIERILEPGCETAFQSVIQHFGVPGRKKAD